MALESGTYINSLNASNPASTDGLGQADDHLRLIKSTVKATFPNVTGEVTADHQELSLLDGATSATSTTVDANDQVILNDAGTMKQVLVSDLATAVNASAGSGSVTSVGITAGSYIDVTGSPITTSGNITVGIQAGYMLPTAADMYDFTQAYSWGNHANAGYLTSAPAPTTSQVASATAGIGADAVGSYALLKASGGNPGATITGSTNYFTNTEWSTGPAVSSSGTWRRMGYTGDAAPTVYLRIS